MMDAGVGPRGSMIVWFYFTRSHTGWGVAARCKIAAPPAPHCGFGTHRTAASARTAPRLGGYGAFAFKNAHFTRELELRLTPCQPVRGAAAGAEHKFGESRACVLCALRWPARMACGMGRSPIPVLRSHRSGPLYGFTLLRTPVRKALLRCSLYVKPLHPLLIYLLIYRICIYASGAAHTRCHKLASTL